MPAASIPGGWTDTLDKKLLLSMLKQCPATGFKWDQVAADMGESLTAATLVSRYHRIKLSVNGDENGVDGPKTPAKPRSGAKKAGSSCKRKFSKDTNAEEDEDDDEEGTPVTKAKKYVKKEITAEDDSYDLF